LRKENKTQTTRMTPGAIAPIQSFLSANGPQGRTRGISDKKSVLSVLSVVKFFLSEHICWKVRSALLLVLFLTAAECSGQNARLSAAGEQNTAETQGDGETTDNAALKTARRDITEPEAAIFPASPRPGEPFTVVLALPFGTAAPDQTRRAVLTNAQGKRLGRAIFFNPGAAPAEDGVTVETALLALPSTIQPGKAGVTIEDLSGREILTLELTVPAREFQSEVIDLDQRNTAIRTEPDPQKTRESELLWTILNTTGTDIYAKKVFMPPVTATRRTSFFGDRRVYRYISGSTDTSVHAGIDYGVPKGTKVTACAPGKVALARFRIVTGNSVVIEHLPGVYSLYYHLDSLSVNEGDTVASGELLGESGATGLATGPHLHWEIRVAGENADPDAFTARPLLDKEAILAILN
jgi:murein DD-endopeptidase MepM/ murein hydrolase activator NlpD